MGKKNENHKKPDMILEVDETGSVSEFEHLGRSICSAADDIADAIRELALQVRDHGYNVLANGGAATRKSAEHPSVRIERERMAEIKQAREALESQPTRPITEILGIKDD